MALLRINTRCDYLQDMPRQLDVLEAASDLGTTIRPYVLEHITRIRQALTGKWVAGGLLSSMGPNPPTSVLVCDGVVLGSLQVSHQSCMGTAPGLSILISATQESAQQLLLEDIIQLELAKLYHLLDLELPRELSRMPSGG